MKIVFTGGWTLGHVIPNLVIIKKLKQEVNPLSIFYIGQKNSLENKITKENKIEFFPIMAGKLRRYFDWQNFIDPFKLIIGIGQSYLVLSRLKPQLVFSKGGFVSVPVVIAAWLKRIPVITHESDITLGLANQINLKFSQIVLTTYPQTEKELQEKYSYKKIVNVGLPIRENLFKGSISNWLKFLGFNKQKPIIFILGGSQGSQKINNFILNNIRYLSLEYQLIWQTGQNNFNDIKMALNLEKANLVNIKILDYIGKEMADLLAVSSVVITRCGATTLFELLALQKKAVLVPLEEGCRGDQLLNAQFMKNIGLGEIVLEKELAVAGITTIKKVLTEKRIKAKSFNFNKIETIIKIIKDFE